MKYWAIALLLIVVGCAVARPDDDTPRDYVDASHVAVDVSVPDPVDCHEQWVDYVLCMEGTRDRYDCLPECKVLWVCVHHDQGISLPSTCDRGWPE